jgi:hypothetical protein
LGDLVGNYIKGSTGIKYKPVFSGNIVKFDFDKNEVAAVFKINGASELFMLDVSTQEQGTHFHQGTAVK